jgi:hypothetical protein
MEIFHIKKTTAKQKRHEFIAFSFIHEFIADVDFIADVI